MSDLEKNATSVDGVRKMEKDAEPDDKEARDTKAEHRIKLALQKDADGRWRNRMDKEDTISTEHYRSIKLTCGEECGQHG